MKEPAHTICLWAIFALTVHNASSLQLSGFLVDDNLGHKSVCLYLQQAQRKHIAKKSIESIAPASYLTNKNMTNHPGSNFLPAATHLETVRKEDCTCAAF